MCERTRRGLPLLDSVLSMSNHIYVLWPWLVLILCVQVFSMFSLLVGMLSFSISGGGFSVFCSVHLVFECILCACHGSGLIVWI